MATVKTVAEAKAYFGLPANCPVVDIEVNQLPANWYTYQNEQYTGNSGERLIHLSKQAC